MSRGENIFKRKDKRWEARYKKGRDINGKIIYGYVYAKTYKEVKEKVLRVQLQEKDHVKKEKKISEVLFSEYCQEWLEINRSKLKDSTYSKYHGIIKNHLLPELGNYKINEINTQVISSFSKKLLEEKNLLPKTIKDILGLFKSIWKYIDTKTMDPLNKITIIYPRECKKNMRILNKQEEMILNRYLLDDMNYCKIGIYITLQTGLRLGEICALQWKNISFEEKFIFIDSSMQRVESFMDGEKKTMIRIDAPKTPHSIRKIPISDSLVTICKKMYTQSEKDYILTGNSKYMEPRTLQKKFEKIMDDCGFENVHFHTLRHTFATRCIELGFDVKTLSEILGHGNVSITMNRYVHPSLELKRKNLEKLWESIELSYK